MSILFKYIFSRFLFKHIALTILIVGLVWIAQSLRYMDLIMNNRLFLGDFFSLVFYLIPDLFVLITPLAFAITLLFGYHRLMITHELSALRALGMSNWQIMKPSLVLGGVLCFTLLVFNMIIVPTAFQKFREQHHILQSAFSGMLLREGNFNTVRNFTVYVKEQTETGELKGIFIYQAASNKTISYTTFADSGNIYSTGDKVLLLLKKGKRQEFNQEKSQISYVAFDEFVYDLTTELTSAAKLPEKPAEKNLKQLLYPEKHILQELRRKFTIEAHQRILVPLLCVLDVFIIASILLAGEVSRRYKKSKVITASTMVFLLHMLTLGLIHSYAQFDYALIVAYGTALTSLLISIAYLIKGPYLLKYFKGFYHAFT